MPELDELEGDFVIRQVLARNGVFEAHRLIAEYKCYRTRADGGTQELLVRVYDMGHDAPQTRYSWEVSVPGAEYPEPVPANPSHSILHAGHNAHWGLLDTEGRKAD